MTYSERFKIIKEEYADLIVNEINRQDILDSFPDSTISLEVSDFSIVHIPVDNMTYDSIDRFGFNSIPSCFGLLTEYGHDRETKEKKERRQAPFRFNQGYTGKEVLIGFIDTGIDYQNQVFRNKDGTSRIISIWDQTMVSSDKQKNIHYGVEYTNEQINLALEAADPLSIVPSIDEIGHGTIMAGIAAGNEGFENEFAGVATEASLAVVKLKPAKAYLKEFFAIPPEAICFQETDIIFAIYYLNKLANHLNKPLILCLGIGNSQSGYMGQRPIAVYLGALSNSHKRGVVVAAGNQGNRGSHYYGEITSGQTFHNVELSVGEDTYGFTMLFWGTAPNWFWIDLYAPDGSYIFRIPYISGNSLLYTQGDMTIIADSRIKEIYSSEQYIALRFMHPIPGKWKFFVYGGTSDLPMSFHIWLPIHNFLSEGTAFKHPNNYTTIVSPGNNNNLICASAYNPDDKLLYYYASRGNAVNNYPKPDITAPGVHSLSPFLNNTFLKATGTSVSAAYVAGVMALLMEWSITGGNFPTMNTALMKKIITQSASRNPEEDYPNPDWGYGIVNLNDMGKVINSIIHVQEYL
ncbi:S8 family peptidase [Anaerocolumna sp. AGMB13020]|uniref:S8 family peptidase n=1 Tax=Anaerocolumna sp. AGMB13020 TaxID=3081750 RepID=UPI002954DC3D|nr:S8 family peptidase [Anaerocolumna sp. AGMB13020]WOO39014.1 S8 family peptidase [Anaerocolumna sp. AGMB13020]